MPSRWRRWTAAAVASIVCGQPAAPSDADSPSTTEASCRRRKQAGWRGGSAWGCTSLCLVGRLAELAIRLAGSPRTAPERRKSPTYSSLDDAVSGACSQPSERTSGVGGGSRTRLNNFADCYLTVWFHQHEGDSIIHLHTQATQLGAPRWRAHADASAGEAPCTPSSVAEPSRPPWIATHLGRPHITARLKRPARRLRTGSPRTLWSSEVPRLAIEGDTRHLDVSPAVHVGFEPTPSA